MARVLMSMSHTALVSPRNLAIDFRNGLTLISWCRSGVSSTTCPSASRSVQTINGQPFATVPCTVHLSDIASFDFPGFNPAAYGQQVVPQRRRDLGADVLRRRSRSVAPSRSPSVTAPLSEVGAQVAWSPGQAVADPATIRAGGGPDRLHLLVQLARARATQVPNNRRYRNAGAITSLFFWETRQERFGGLRFGGLARSIAEGLAGAASAPAKCRSGVGHRAVGCIYPQIAADEERAALDGADGGRDIRLLAGEYLAPGSAGPRTGSGG